MAKKKQPDGVFLISIGLLILLSMSNLNIEREAKPSYDGERNYFDLELLEKADRAEAGDLYWADIKITNTEEVGGTMYVQCSVLDRTTNEWIVGLQSATMLDNDDNCVDDEPFTQTAQITLEGLQFSETRFTFEVPNTPEGENVLWCEAYERCYSEDEEVMRSSHLIEPIAVVRADNNPDNNIANGDMCEFDSECKKFWFIGEQTCVQGFCVDPKDVPDSSDKQMDLPDVELKEWALENKISITFVGLILLLVGSMVVYQKPKNPSQMRFG